MIEEIRVEKGVTKKAVADCLGVSAPTYDRYEADPLGTMTADQLSAVMSFLGVRARLEMGKGEPIFFLLSSAN